MLLSTYGVAGVLLALGLRALRRPVPAALLVVSAALPFLLLPEAAFLGRLVTSTDATAADPPFAGRAGAPPWNPVLLDGAVQFLPWDTVARDCLLAGRPPLWNRFQGGGVPLLANGSSAILSPFSLAGVFLPPARAATLAVFLKIFVAALGAGVLVLELGCAVPGALLAAVSYGASNFVIVWSLHPQSGVAATAPWILASLVALAAGRPRATARLALAVAAAALAGFVQTFVLSLLAALLLAAGLFAVDRTQVAWLGRALAALALGGLLAAPALLPFGRLTLLSEELPRRVAWAAERPGPAPAEALRRLATFPVPDVFGRPQDRTWRGDANYTERSSSSTGAVALVFALAALAGSGDRRRRVLTVTFSGIAALGLVASSGLLGADLVVRRVPFVREGDPARFQLLAALALPAMAALGLDGIPRATRRRIVAAGGAVLLAVVATSFAVQPDGRLARAAAVRETAPALVAARAAALGAPGPALPAVVLAAAAVERIWTVGSYLPRIGGDRVYPCGDACRFLKEHAAGARVAGLGFTFLPNQPAVLALEDVRAYDNLSWLPLWETTHLWRQRNFPGATLVDDPNRPFLRFLGLRWLVAPSGAPPPKGWTVRYDGPGGQILETADALPRFFVPRRVVAALPAQQLHVAARIHDFAETAAADLPEAMSPAPARIVEESRSPDGYRLSVEADGNTFVVSSQPAYPGWRVLVDGHPHPLVVVNHAFVGFGLPPGRHRVALELRDDDILLGCGLCLAAGLALVLSGARQARKSRQAGLALSSHQR